LSAAGALLVVGCGAAPSTAVGDTEQQGDELVAVDPDLDACATVRCIAGTHCEAQGDQAQCVPDVFCGGIAGMACPGAGQCVDDPTDDCDLENGGADCGGNCQCISLALCIQGYHFDTSPEVCGCVEDYNPCAATLCLQGTECVVKGDEAVCVPQNPKPPKHHGHGHHHRHGHGRGHHRH
jgi:hypothetical protein